MWWKTTNENIWDKASYLARANFPHMYERYKAVNVSLKFGIWTSAALNVNFAVNTHKDSGDDEDGICAVIVFGEFEGGEICFPDQLICIPVVGGYIVIFHSCKYRHYVANFVGCRYSIVLYTQKSVIKNSNKL